MVFYYLEFFIVHIIKSFTLKDKKHNIFVKHGLLRHLLGAQVVLGQRLESKKEMI